MAVRRITTRLDVALENEQKFKSQMTEVNGELRNLRSEIGLLEEEFRGQNNTVEYLTKKDQLLRQEIEQQEEKVRALEQAVKDASVAYGDTDRETDKFRQSLNRAKTDLLKMNRELEGTDKHLDEAKRSADGTAKSIDGFGREVKDSSGFLSNFTDGLADLNRKSRTLDSEMKLVESTFRGQANTVEALSEKKRILSEKIEQQKVRIQMLAQAVVNSSKAYGDAAEQTDEFRQQLNLAQADMLDWNRAVQDVNKHLDEAKRSADGTAKSIDGFGREVKDSSGFLSDFTGGLADLKKAGSSGDLTGFVSSLGTLKNVVVGGAVVAGLSAAKDAIFGIVESTEEYRKVMGTLEVSSQAAGYSAEQTRQAYNKLYSVLGDTQAAATATANLQAIGAEQETIMAITENAIGAWAKYGDSIPIDSLAEAINETIQVGKVTGAFADVLNWAGTNEDAFNAKLEAANSISERTNIVLQEMAQQGLSDAADAWLKVNDDIAKANEAQAKMDEAMGRLGEALAPLTTGLINFAADGISFVTEAISDLGDMIQWAADKFDGTSEAVRQTRRGFGDLTGASNQLNEQLLKVAESTEESEEAVLSLTDAQNLLTSALDEQRESGSLNLSTALKLIDAGYAAAISIDQETGAVTLNREAYIQAAQAKLDDQIASLETQRQSVRNALLMKDEALMALDLGKSYLNAAQAREALEGRETSFSAQIAALGRLKESLGNYTFSVQKVARTSSSVAKAEKTQAEKALESFQEIKAALDHEKAMDEVDEKEYYARLARYRDQYLTDNANLDEYRKVTEQIYDYDKSLADAEASLWEEQTQALVSELEERVKTVQDEQNAMAQSLAGSGALFRIEDDEMALESIQDQIDAINAYEEALTGLKERGISDSLMNEVLGMDMGEATQYAGQLMAMTGEQWDEYNTLWEDKQRRAVEVAEKFYRDQLDALQTEYDDKLGQALSELTDTAFTSGEDTAQGLIDGLASKENELYGKAQDISNEMSRILSSASVTSIKTDGSHAGGLDRVPYDGYVAELHKDEAVLTKEEAAVWHALSAGPPAASQGVTAQELQQVTAAAVNAINLQGSGGVKTIVLQMNVNGKEFYRETIEDFRDVNRENPEVTDDR